MQAIFTLNPYSKRFCFWVIFAFCLGMSLQPLRAQQIAFPGAEGAGRFTSGGRGTSTSPSTVFEVTKLDDDGSAGTLRWALTQTATYRTIVFRVSGTIHLNSRLTIRGNTTIAGQTAPGGGICIADHPTVISGDNVIVRYLRFRMGDKNQNKGYVDGSGGDDTFSGMDNNNVIIDHCSVSWSSDEAMTFYRGDNLTLQWNIISEPLNYSYHYESPGPDFQEHGYGGIWGGKNASFHHNLIAHAKGRMPRFSGSGSFGDGKTPGLENADFRNNVIYNWGSYSTNGGEGGNYNIVNNYYKYGPSTTSGTTSGVDRRNMIMNPSKSTDLPYPKIFMEGNYVDNSSAITQNNWKGVAMASGTLADTAQSKVQTPFGLPAITTQSAQDAYELVLTGAGAVLPNRDTLDQRIVNDVRNRTGRIIDVQGGYAHGTAYAQTVNAWPTLTFGAAPLDTDHDGMPDSWEAANGLNANNAADRNNIASSGYTMLEVYLNSLTSTGATINPSINVFGSLNFFSQTLGTPSASQSVQISGANLTSNVTVTPPANYEVSLNGTTWSGNAQPLVLTASNGVLNATTLNVRLNATTGGTYNGNLILASNGANSLNIALSGLATTPVHLPSITPNVIVAKDGSGQYTSIQAAIDAAPTNRTAPYIIYIKNGKYQEKVNIPSNKPFLHLVGESAANTIITWDDYSGKANPAGGTFGTSTSATVTISSNDCFVANITMENSTGYTGDGPQALAINVSGDRCAFKNCRFISGQDTVLANGDGKRQYFRNCYIDGNTDFIFGSSIAVFDSCVIFPRDRVDGANGGYVTAANTPQSQTYGYVFRDCKLTMNRGITLYTLGRPWQNDAATTDKKGNKTVFLNSYMGNSIKAEGWSTWDAGTNTSIITYAEYKTKKFDGTLANVSGRVSWSKQLTDAEAADYYDNTKVLGNWDPCTTSPLMCAGSNPEIAVSNFRVKKGTSSTPSVISCNISWPIAGIKYELFRSSDNISFSKINELVVNNDTAVNFVYTDAIPSGGSSYYYYIKASRDGIAAHTTETMQVSSVPTVTVSGSFKPFNQYYGSASSTQLVSVAGANLIGNVTITPPANFQVSVDNGTNWSGSAITLTPTSGSIATTNLLVRLNAPALGSYADSLVMTSNGATRLAFLLSGTNVIYVAPTSVVLQQWPLTANGVDSVGVRATGLTASTLTLNKLYTSNGTQLPGVTAYHPVTGMAYAASASGDGFWTSAVGGPGGNLNRTNYVQFTVTASAGYSVKVDSFLLSNNIISSTSNTKLAVVYSKSNFVSDSINVTGGLATIPPADPAPIVSTANGGFTTPVVIAVSGSSSTGPTNRYAFAFNDAAGVTVAAGETLTIRLYNSCGSTSAGRYGMLKNVIVKGTVTDLNAPPPAITTTGTLSSFNQPLGSPSAYQTIALAGTNLTSHVMIVPPANFQISPDAGTTWYSNTSPLMLNQSNGTLAATNILVRLNASAVGNYNGNIIASANGVTREIAVIGNTSVPVVPIIGVNSSMTNFSQTVGAAAVAQTFTITGNNLTGAITIAAPTHYQVSFDGANWSNNLTLTSNSGTVAATTIHVRLNASTAGTYTGTIHLTSSGAEAKSVAVNGVTVPAPAVAVSGALNAFTQTVGMPSVPQTFTVSGTNLTGTVTITPPAQYQVSSNGGTTWASNASPLVLTPASGTLTSTIITVRLNATAAGVYNGSISVTSNGAVTASQQVSGITVSAPSVTVSGTLSAFTQTLGAPSAVQTITVAGADLTAGVTVTPAPGYEVSTNGTTWFNNAAPLVISPVNGVVAATPVSVRLNATASGNHAGNIVVASGGATAQNKAVSGTAVLAPMITVNNNLASFTQTHGTSSVAQSFTVSGSNLTGSIKVARSADFEISLNGNVWTDTVLTLTPTNGVVNASILVRMHAKATGSINGSVTLTSNGANSVHVALTGTTYTLLTVSPNPAKSFIQVHHPKYYTVGTLTLYNMNGVKIASYNTVSATDKTEIQVGHLPAGIYFIEYRGVKGNATMRFIKE